MMVFTVVIVRCMKRYLDYDKITKYKSYVCVALVAAALAALSVIIPQFFAQYISIRSGYMRVIGGNLNKTITYTIVATLSGGTNDFTVAYFKPLDTVNQRVISENISLTASKAVGYKEKTINVNGNKLVVLYLDNVSEQNKISITYQANVEVVEAIIKLKKVPSGENLSKYVISQNETPSVDMRIRNLAYSLRDRGENQIETIINIHNWVRNNIRYKSTPLGRQSAIETLDKGSGDCDDKAILEVTMLRSENIPSRVVVGLSDGGDSVLPTFHAWVEVYTDYGWIPGDPTNTNLEFGELTTNHIKIYHEVDSGIEAGDVGINGSDIQEVTLGPLIKVFWRGNKQPIIDWDVYLT